MSTELMRVIWLAVGTNRWRDARQDGASPPLPSRAPAHYAQDTLDFG
ncbi:hypothetical protein OG599_34435 [Streptomyces sp. NBC_01335]|nr:hypothetical protein OG599_00015 [Streptomyces sp. NBC_01335]WSI74770.1 hypothetical protein OG599_34435 [Streptomyces sp. NBC_01335]